MTIGDVIGIISVVLTIIATLSSATVLVTIIAAAKVDVSVATLIDRPKKLLLRGLALALIAIFCAVFFHLATIAPVKLALGGAMVLLGVFALFGSAVMASLVGGRIRPANESISSGRVLYQGALICLVASLAPIIGWFLVAPVMLAATLGAGSLIVWPLRHEVSVPKPLTVSPETVLS